MLKIVYFLILIVPIVSNGKSDFSIQINSETGSSENKKSLYPHSSWIQFTQRLIQTNFKCEFSVQVRFFGQQKLQSYNDIGPSYCRKPFGSSALSLGYVNLDWSHSVGVGSADILSVYDFQRTLFVEKKDRRYNPGLLYEYFTDSSTYSLYIGSPHNFDKYLFDTQAVADGQLFLTYSQQSLDILGRYAGSFWNGDISLFGGQVVDRRGHYKLESYLTPLVKENSSFDVMGFGFSKSSQSTTTRLDFIYKMNQKFLNHTGVVKQSPQALMSIGLDFSFFDKWSLLTQLLISESLVENKEAQNRSQNEWALISIRYQMRSESSMEAAILMNHYDQNGVARIIYQWPNKRFTTLLLGYEYLEIGQIQGSALSSYPDKWRAYFGFDINLTR